MRNAASGGVEKYEAPIQEPKTDAVSEPTAVDPYQKLKEAKELLDAGILTEEEFAAEKKKLLG